MKLKRILLTALSVVVCASAVAAKKSKAPKSAEKRPAVCVWNYDQMVAAREDIRKKGDASTYKANYDVLIASADKLLDAKPTTVMDNDDKRLVKPETMGASKHDFLNTSKYVWPDGKGWLKYDETQGVNTDWRNYSVSGLGPMVNRIKTLGLAYYFSGDEKYAAKAVEFARVWYLDPETKMNPNYQYGVVRPVNGKPGEYVTGPAGVINCHSHTYVMAGLSLIRGSKAYTPEFDKGMKEWVSQLYDWMLNHEYGKAEDRSKGNHAVAYDQVMLSFALFVGNDAEAKRIVDSFPEKRIFKQIEPNGEMAQETRRESGFHYSNYNLGHLMEFCDMAMEINPKLYYSNQDGRSIENAIKFLVPYLGGTRADWQAASGKAGQKFKEYGDGTFERTQVVIACWAYRAARYSPDAGFMKAFEIQKAQTMSDPKYNKDRFRLRDNALLYITE